jgi:serine/threonine protein kinase HipA of HipAB toxin-antitoxin module
LITAFLYEDESWELSLAYNLVYSSSFGGEHASTVNGNGSTPGMHNMVKFVVVGISLIAFDVSRKV